MKCCAHFKKNKTPLSNNYGIMSKITRGKYCIWYAVVSGFFPLPKATILNHMVFLWHLYSIGRMIFLPLTFQAKELLSTVVLPLLIDLGVLLSLVGSLNPSHSNS